MNARGTTAWQVAIIFDTLQDMADAINVQNFMSIDFGVLNFLLKNLVELPFECI